MPPSTILVAGATGHLGRQVVREFHERGHRVRALGRSAERLASLREFTTDVRVADLREPRGLVDVVSGVDVVFSCAGASVDPSAMRDRVSYRAVDFNGNLNLIEATKAAGVRRFVYVSLCGGRGLRHTEYADAHEGVVDALGASGLSHTTVRPTGFFSFFDAVLDAVCRGMGPVIGDGSVRTNPIHEADLAKVCASAIESDARDIEAGGPVIYTRRGIVELAFATLGRKPKLMHVPFSVFRGMARLMKPINPRIAAILHFGAEVSSVDCVAPTVGTRDLGAHFSGRLKS